MGADEIKVDFYRIEMVKPFPFPWPKPDFFDAFPETFLQVPAAIKPVPAEILATKYDLILLHYQVWYLSPSIPFNSFLKSPEAKKLLNDTPVVTINGSRNMWVMAQEKVKALLKQNNAKLKGNVALVDRAGNLVSVITIVRWMFSGVKRKYLGIFPLPGVSDEDIAASGRFGTLMLAALREDKLDELQPKLVAADGVRIRPYLAMLDKTANKVFGKWAGFIYKKKETRKLWLKAFNLYLFLAIWLISPIVYILYAFSYPLRLAGIKKATKYYQGVNLI